MNKQQPNTLLLSVLQTSRPRFWMYTVGPYVLGTFLAAPNYQTFTKPLFWGLLSIFTLAANVLIYGVNDLADGDTDANNVKKEDYERLLEESGRRPILGFVLLSLILLLCCAIGQPLWTWGLMLAFIALSIGYSVKPLRFKARPALDSLSNILYAFPGFIAVSIWRPGATIPAVGVAAAWLWCMAMHTFSAIPDVTADREAGLQTTATWLGTRGALLYCCLCWLGSAVCTSYAFGSTHLGIVWAAAAFLVYAYMVVSCLIAGGDEQSTFKHYRFFPVINGFIGFGTTMIVLYLRWPVLRP